MEKVVLNNSRIEVRKQMDIFRDFPKLKTKRLNLSRVTLDHAEDAYEFYSDNEVMKGHGEQGLKTMPEVKERIQDWYVNPYENKSGIRFGIFLQDTGKLIGSCGFWRIVDQHFKGEIGYELASNYHRTGIMKEALQRLIVFGFENLNLNRIEAKTDEYNIGSQSTLTSLGFVKEGVQRESEYEEGKFVDIYHYALLRKEWD
ncbi:GNAT family N-acetyltransferase [Bacillus sp. DJP31]|uniref:GNAT family N-acetyltransferase n=1 Tax=Bacillus sp. DJP31 TaxID=3409789 RepID=UPI003BB4CE95